MDGTVRFSKVVSRVTVLVLLLVLTLQGSAGLANVPTVAAAQGTQILNFSGTLAPGETRSMPYPYLGAQDKKVNLKLQVTGSGSINLAVTDGGGATLFAGTALGGETLWATFSLKPGTNTFALTNPGGSAMTYTLRGYEIGSPVYAWSGTSQGSGTWRSRIQLNFPSGGLYQFNLGVTSGRYQFLLGDAYIQKTVEVTNTVVSYYVPAGTHVLRIEPDGNAATTSWTLNITGPGATSDTLPYEKAGRDLGGAGNPFGQEWLPLNLAAASPANLSLALAGNSTDSMDVYLYGATGTTPVYTVTDVYGGETLWWTKDLPSGTSRLRLVADPGNAGVLAYSLGISEKPAVPSTWAGSSRGVGNNSQVRFEVPAAGLYDFSYGAAAGRYQFLVNSEPHIQKTVETTGTVRYYLSAGTHELTVVQDTAQASTAWSLEVTATGVGSDALPYTKSGGNLGGAGNDFGQEWLPLSLPAGSAANFRLALSGDAADGLRVYLYQGAGLVYTTPVVYGGETVWWTADLAASVNRLHLVAQGANASSLQYELTASAIPTLPHTWSGVAKGSGGNSVARVQVPSEGTYHVKLDTPQGFGQVIVDASSFAMAGGVSAQSPGHLGEFDMPLSEGLHSFTIKQSPDYPTTAWTIAVTPTVAGASIAHFSGDLSSGEVVNPQYPLAGSQNKEVNFRLIVPAAGGSGQLDLVISDGAGGTAFTGSILDGETLWGTAVLKPGQNTFTLTHAAGPTLSYDLTVFEIGTAPYDWSSVSRAAGTWVSHIKLHFGADALYTFDLGVAVGRYQLQVGGEYIAKTAEANGQVTYYVPAGDHVLRIVPDRAVDVSCTSSVSAPGAAADTLPYTKAGGHLWAAAAKFNEEWLPLNLATQSATNFKLALTGAAADAMDVYVYDGLTSNVVYSITGVYGGETVWWTTDLPAGLSRVRLVAGGGNASSLAYNLAVQQKPTISGSTSSTWAGSSRGVGNNSQVRFEVPAAGLYDFSYGAAAGRYQFLVNSEPHIQKTVETTGTVRYYLSAGTHELTVVQDTAQASTAWSLEVTATGVGSDALPYTKSGGNLGGAGNDFGQEWLPLSLPAGSAANFRLALSGDAADGLRVYLYQGAGLVYTTPVVYGGETVWWTADLAASANRLHLVAQGTNASSLQYELAVQPIPVTVLGEPYTWSGVSLGSNQQAHSEIQAQIPVTGFYRIEMDTSAGFASLEISGIAQTAGLAPQQSHTEFDALFEEGPYLFRVQQSDYYITTSWTATITLLSVLPPEISSIDPVSVTNNVSHTVTIHGANFQPGVEVQIDSITLSPVIRLDSTRLQVVVPAGTAPGTYSVTVTNPDSQSATLEDALLVIRQEYKVYLPVTVRNTP